ncbi:MAG TPA: porin family protein [Flavobacterium sp.]|nr:porin family protein [Flavobacterium sp.]
MIRKITIIALLAIVSNTAFAQHKIKYGINAGATYSKFYGNSSVKSFNRGLDFMAGVSADYYVSEHFSIKANLSYERITSTDQQQVEVRENFDDPPVLYDVKFKINYNYLTLPVVAKYEFPKMPSLFVESGIFIGYLLKSGASNDLPVAGLGGSDDNTGMNKKFNTGITLGIGKTIPLNAKNDLVIELRDNIGLINTSDVEVIDNGTIKTNSINLIVGWSFGL